MTWYLMDLPKHYLMDPIIDLSLQDADPAIHVLSESRCPVEVQTAARVWTTSGEEWVAGVHSSVHGTESGHDVQ